MTHFKATHEPFDYPERNKKIYDGVIFPEPESLYDFNPEISGRKHIGQVIENLTSRWLKETEKMVIYTLACPFNR